MQIVAHARMYARTDGQAQTNMPPQLLQSWGQNHFMEVG